MKLTKSQREQVRLMFDGRCAYCGIELGKLWHADHIEPLMRKFRIERVKGDRCRTLRFVPTGEAWNPSANRIDNFFPACVPCNIDKTVYSVEDWRQALANRIRTLNNQSCYRHAKRFGLVKETGAEVVFYFERLAGRSLTLEDLSQSTARNAEPREGILSTDTRDESLRSFCSDSLLKPTET